MKTKVLILEDAKIGGLALDAIKQRGMDGRWFVSVKSVDNENLVGVHADGEVETVALADYGLALVDGFLLITGMMGWEVLPSLNPLMYTVGTSSAGDIGAHTAIEKEHLVEQIDRLLESAKLPC